MLISLKVTLLCQYAMDGTGEVELQLISWFHGRTKTMTVWRHHVVNKSQKVTGLYLFVL